MKTKNVITVILISAWLFAGCGTVKSWLGLNKDDQQEQLVPPPPKGDVTKNPDGSYNFSDEQLSSASMTESSLFKWVTLLVFLVTTALIARHLIKKDDA